MVTFGFTLLGIGLLLGFGSFLFALSNMAGFAMVAFGQVPERNPEAGFGNMFQKHIHAMVGLAVGGLCGLLGLLLVVSGSMSAS